MLVTLLHVLAFDTSMMFNQGLMVGVHAGSKYFLISGNMGTKLELDPWGDVCYSLFLEKKPHNSLGITPHPGAKIY
jgi:hypothetical protein